MNNNNMTQQQLEKYLWGAATYLRGHIDAGDYKQYMFPLMFFKRISDGWAKEMDLQLLIEKPSFESQDIQYEIVDTTV